MVERGLLALLGLLGLLALLALLALHGLLALLESVSAREEARLFISIPGALAPQFQMQEGSIRTRINQIFGYDFVTKIVFEHKI